MAELASLPAADRIERGLRALARGEWSADALLVAIAASRLRGLDFDLPDQSRLPRDPELALYRMLGSTSEDPFFAYRAALAELDSFLACCERLTEGRRTRAEQRTQAAR